MNLGVSGTLNIKAPLIFKSTDLTGAVLKAVRGTALFARTYEFGSSGVKIDYFRAKTIDAITIKYILVPLWKNSI